MAEVDPAIPNGTNQPYYVPDSQSQQIRRAALDFVNKANDVANGILNIDQNTNGTNTAPVYIGRVEYYYPPSYGWGYPPVYVFDGGGRRTRNDDDSGARVLLGLLATIVGAVAVYKLGNNINRYRQAEEELQDISPFRKWSLLHSSSTPEADKALFQKVEKVAVLETRIFKRIRDNAVFDLATTVGLVAGCALALIGSIFAMSGCMAMGLLTGLTAGAFQLLNWGMDSSDWQFKRDAQRLKAEIATLQ